MKVIMLASLALVLGYASSSYAQEERPHVRVGKELDFAAMIKPIRDAEALLAARKYAAAEKAFRALDPDFLRTDVRMGLGEAILGQKRFGEALEVFETLSLADRESQKIPFQLKYSVALYAVGRRREALNLYTDSVKGIPSSMGFGRSMLPLSFRPRTTTFRQFEVDSRTAIAFYHLSVSNSAEALPEAQRAIYLDPTHVLARCAEAIALLRSEPELAIRKFEALEKTALDPLKQELQGAMPGLQELAGRVRNVIDAKAKEARSGATNNAAGTSSD